MRCNPPWTDKILTKHWAALEARVGAAWMPVAMTEVRGVAELREDIKRMQAAADRGMVDPFWVQKLYDAKANLLKLERQKPKGYREYGCGHYGCVMPTSTPGLVIKITTDQTEAAFVAAYLSMKPNGRPVGIVPYHKLLAIRSESRLKRPVFVLWREEAQHLGVDGIRTWIGTHSRKDERDYYHNSLKKVMHCLGNCLDAGRSVRGIAERASKRAKDRIITKPDGGWEVVREKTNLKAFMAEAVGLMDMAWEGGGPHQGRNLALRAAWFLSAFRQNADDLSSEVMGHYLGRGLGESFDAGLLLCDVHLNNIGMPTGKLAEEIGMTPIITDPGHAIALDDRYSGVQVKEL